MEAVTSFFERYAVYLPELFGLPLELLVVLAGFGVVGAWLVDMLLKHAAFGMILNFFILQLGAALAFLVAMTDFRIVLTDNAALTMMIAVAGASTLLGIVAAFKNRVTP